MQAVDHWKDRLRQVYQSDRCRRERIVLALGAVHTVVDRSEWPRERRQAVRELNRRLDGLDPEDEVIVIVAHLYAALRTIRTPEAQAQANAIYSGDPNTVIALSPSLLPFIRRSARMRAEPQATPTALSLAHRRLIDGIQHCYDGPLRHLTAERFLSPVGERRTLAGIREDGERGPPPCAKWIRRRDGTPYADPAIARRAIEAMLCDLLLIDPNKRHVAEQWAAIIDRGRPGQGAIVLGRVLNKTEQREQESRA